MILTDPHHILMPPLPPHSCVVQLLFPLLDPDQPTSSEDLQSSNEVLTLSVFDEVLTATSARRLAQRQRPAGTGAEDPILAATEALGEGGALPEKERRYLGSVRVPVAAIYQADLLQGAFKVCVVVGGGLRYRI
jgi:hypothetical protein